MLRLPPPIDLRGLCTVRCWVNLGLAVAITGVLGFQHHRTSRSTHHPNTHHFSILQGFVASIASLTLFLVPGQAEAIMEKTEHGSMSFFDDRTNVRVMCEV